MYKQIIEKSKGITAVCFECNKAVSFIYDIEMNIYYDDKLFESECEYQIPNLKIRCNKCKNKMTLYSNAISRLNKAIDGFILSQDKFISNTSYNWNINVIDAKDNGIHLEDGKLVHKYDYPSITYTFKDHIDRWKYAYIFMIATDLNEFLYNSKSFVSISLDLNQETSIHTLTISLDEENINYCYIDSKEEMIFTDYMTNKFNNLLDRCAETIEKLKDIKSEDVITKYAELVGDPKREFKYIDNQ